MSFARADISGPCRLRPSTPYRPEAWLRSNCVGRGSASGRSETGPPPPSGSTVAWPPHTLSSSLCSALPANSSPKFVHLVQKLEHEALELSCGKPIDGPGDCHHQSGSHSGGFASVAVEAQRRRGCAASSGACVDIGGPVAERGSEAKWDGAPELARLGASLQRRGSGGALLMGRPWPGTAVE